MIVDNVIDEVTARYYCAANKKFIEDAVKEARKFSKDDSSEKLGVQTAIAIGPNSAEKLKQTVDTLDEREEQLNENWFTNALDFLFNSPPAWVDEPTGFNDSRPEAVFKNDVQGGIEGFNTGSKMAAASGAIAIAGSIPGVRNAAANLGKFTVKHPVATTIGAVAASNPKETAELAKNGYKDFKKLGDAAEKVEPYIDKICAFFQPLVDFFKEHPLFASAIGAIGYGLLRTYPIWWPYIRRLGYEITSGKLLAKVDFEANDSSWSFEYTLKKNKWVLLNAGRIASQEDSVSFMNTKFAQRFMDQCKKNFESFFKHKDVILAQASLVGGESLVKSFQKFFDEEQSIRSNMFYGKMIFEDEPSK